MNSLANLLKIITQTYFGNFWCAVIISDSDLSFNIQIPQLIYRVAESQNVSFLQIVMETGCHGYIVQLDNVDNFFESFDDTVHKINHRYGRKRFVILPSSERFDKQNYIKFLYVSSLPDLIVLNPVFKKVGDEINFFNMSDKFDYDYEIYSFKFVGKENFADLILYDVWFGENRTFLSNAKLFPDKMYNLEGRPLRVSTFHYPPSSIFWTDGDGVHLDGTEMKIALEYCRWVNCTVELIHYEEELEWGELFSNNTGIGMLGNVYHDRADVGFGSTCMWFHEYTFLDLSSPFIRTGITTIAPMPKLVEDFLVPYLPFTYKVWIAFVLTIIFSIWILYYLLTVEIKQWKLLKDKDLILISKQNDVIGPQSQLRGSKNYQIKGKKRFNQDMANMTNVTNLNNFFYAVLSILDIILLQGGGYGGGGRGLVLRSFLLFYALFITNAYMCGLTSTLTLPRYMASTDTVADMAAHGLRWGATHDAWIFSIRGAKEENLVTVRNNFVNLPPQKLQDRWTDDQFAYGVERLEYGHFAAAAYITEQAVSRRRLMGGDIYWDWYVAMFRKSSPHKLYYDKLIGRIRQAGLMKAWEAQVVAKFLDWGVQRSIASSRLPPPHPPTMLSPHHVQGALLLWAGGLTLAILAFLIEIIVYSFTNMRKSIP